MENMDTYMEQVGMKWISSTILFHDLSYTIIKDSYFPFDQSNGMSYE